MAEGPDAGACAQQTATAPPHMDGPKPHTGEELSAGEAHAAIARRTGEPPVGRV